MTEEPVSLLVPIDPARFEELEHVIEHGLGTFVEVGRALLRSSSGACTAQPGTGRSPTMSRDAGTLSSTHAYRQIEASKVVDILSPIGDMPLPANEAQARELAPLVDDPEAVRAVWIETVQDGEGRITGALGQGARDGKTSRRSDQGAGVPRGLVVRALTTCPACGHQWRR